MLRFVFIILFASSQFTGFSQGINFFDGSWEDALQEAGKTNKIIFVDAYAKWCGPCKKMARDVFTQDHVGAFFNDNFVNLKLDMEEKEGLTFGQKYPVGAYPTLFFIDNEGNIIKKVVGGKQADDLLNIARMAIKSFDRSDVYAEKYEAGERDFELVLNYVRELNKVDKPSQKIANEYLDSNPDIDSKQKAEFLLAAVQEADSKLFDQLVELRSEAIKIASRDDFEDLVSRAAMKTVEKAVEYDYPALLEEAIQQFESADIGDKKQFEFEARMFYHALSGNYPEWINLSKKFIKKYGKKDEALVQNQISHISMYFSYLDESDSYALELGQKLIDINDTPANFMMYLRMLMNMDRKQEAYEYCKSIRNRFEGDPMQDQFNHMMEYLEKSI